MNAFNESLHLFDQLHCIALGLSVMSIFGVPLIGRYLSTQNRRRAVWALIVFAVVQEIVDYANRASFRELNLIQDLPLHLCNYGLVIAAVGLVSRNQFCFEVAYFTGTTAVMQALLTPNLDDLANLTEYVVYFIHHALIIQFAIWNLVVDRMLPERGAVARTILFIVLMMGPIAIVNWLTQANYMFICERPEVHNPLVLGAWPWYICSGLFIGWALMLVSAIPILWLRRKKAK
ncbi:MAG: TIGR02206 family membrane protein [Verrucomicrobiota bacterium]|nr:TIGR02206 family membrane protein [Verrucomicrobiota bacterium]MEE2614701.1 TIGR02206 family membrane protein [Verrucomicrobiota bacterium]